MSIYSFAFLVVLMVVGPMDTLAERYSLDVPLRECPGDFVWRLLDVINRNRYDHYTLNLEMHYGLNDEAQNWANQLLQMNSETEQNNNYGQIIFRRSGGSRRISFDIEYDLLRLQESQFYKSYDKEATTYEIDSTRHFAQVVWGSTKQIGFGCAGKENYGESVLYVVLFFDPKGLVNGKYRYNVLPAYAPTSFRVPSHGCPEEFERNALSRINENRGVYINGQPIEYNQSLNAAAQAEADRLSQIGRGMSEMTFSKDYGTMGLKIEYPRWMDSIKLPARYPVDSWKGNTPTYIRKDGSLDHFSHEKWIKPLQMGIGCAARNRQYDRMQSVLYTIYVFVEKLIPVTTTTSTTTTTQKPPSTSTTTRKPPSTTTTTRKPPSTTTTTRKPPSTTTTTRKPPSTTTTTRKPPSTTTTTRKPPSTTTTTRKPPSTSTTTRKPPSTTTTTRKPTSTTTTTRKPTSTTTTTTQKPPTTVSTTTMRTRPPGPTANYPSTEPTL